MRRLFGMDRVRLGRVLGRGARMAARTVYDAVDAATTPSPAAEVQRPSVGPQQMRPAASAHRTRSAVQTAVQAVGQVHGSARAARQGVLAPVKRASRAVSLEIAGSFFALFALSFSVAAWRFHGLAQGGAAQRFWPCMGLAVLFGYFACSSFLRARRISRQ